MIDDRTKADIMLNTATLTDYCRLRIPICLGTVPVLA